MSYADRFQEAADKGSVEQSTTEIYQWVEEDQVLIGELVAMKPFTDGKFDTDVLQYIFDTDSGRVSTVLGAATDKQLAGLVHPGDLFKITYRGKKHLEDGRQVNLFDIKKAV